MKKKLRVLLLIFVGIFLIKNIDVNAATKLPATYSGKGYDYSIEALKIECYANPSGALKEEQKIKETTLNYETNNFDINPELTVGNIDGASAVSINLNLKFNQTNLGSSFTDYAKNLVNDKPESKYICLLRVDYKLKKKEDFNYFYEANALLFQKQEELLYKPLQVNGEYYSSSQVIDVVGFDNNLSSVTTEYLGLNGSYIGVIDYAIMSSRELNNESQFESDKDKLLYIHNISNFSEFMNSNEYDISTLTPQANNTPKNETKVVQTISVPDTSANNSLYILVGSLILLFGSTLMLLELRKKKVK